jgi:hypothetical protein
MTKQTLLQFLYGLLNTSRKDFEAIMEEVIEDCQNGHEDPLKIFAGLRMVGQIVAPEPLESLALNELGKYGKSTNLHFAKVDLGSHTSYDYSHDSIWQGLKEKETDIATLRKNREKILKLAPAKDTLKGVEGMIETDPETGETYTVAPAIAYSKPLIKLTWRSE